MATPDFHVSVRQSMPPAFADYMDEIYESLSPAERDRLPEDIGRYCNEIISIGLERLPQFAESLKRAVAGVYHQSPQGERFLEDASRRMDITEYALFLDKDSELVTVRNPQLRRQDNAAGFPELIMANCQSYLVLTGPLSGRKFDRHDRPLPQEPPRPYRGLVAEE